MYGTQASDTTAIVRDYVAYEFQLTRAEKMQIREAQPALPKFHGPVSNVNLVVIDGEVCVLSEGSPPGFDALPEHAGLLDPLA